DGPPRLFMFAVESRLAGAAKIDREIPVARFVIEEVVLDHRTLVTHGQQEAVEAKIRVEFHDVPEDRPLADLNERLRTQFRLLAETHAASAAENHDCNVVFFHVAYCFPKRQVHKFLKNSTIEPMRML